MPRSVDIILRHQSVEKAKAGDKAVFTGSLVVVPDVAQLSGSGKSAKLHPAKWEKSCFSLTADFFILLAGRTSIISGGSREGYSEEGITGLKQLGVRDLTYKLSFLGTTVVPKDVKVCNAKTIRTATPPTHFLCFSLPRIFQVWRG